MTNRDASVVADLERSLPPGSVVADLDVVRGYADDWTRRFRGSPVCVVRARSRADVVEVLKRSAALGFPVVAQGGNTGLVGATMAPPGSVILNLGSLDRIIESYDPSSLVAEAGTTLAAVQKAASVRGRVFGLDMASRHTATVGGAFATNAGGVYASYWGRMRNQVVGVEAVLADGTVLSTLDSPTDSVGGIDPTGILAGSEGTLAVVTALRIRLHPPSDDTVVLLAGFNSIEDAQQLAVGARGVVAAELFGGAEMEAVVNHGSPASPLDIYPWYLLLEVEERSIDTLRIPDDAVVGSALWAYREGITEAISGLDVVHKFDVVVPWSRLDALRGDLSRRLDPHRLFVFGHLLRSNFHINVAPSDPGKTVPEEVDQLVFDAVEEAGGELAAEHGVGRAKASRVRRSLDPGRRNLADSLKQAFDPDGRLNPGVGPALL